MLWLSRTWLRQDLGNAGNVVAIPNLASPSFGKRGQCCGYPKLGFAKIWETRGGWRGTGDLVAIPNLAPPRSGKRGVVGVEPAWFVMFFLLLWGCSSAGRAQALQAWGQGFDPLQLHTFFLACGVTPTRVTDLRNRPYSAWVCYE